MADDRDVVQSGAIFRMKQADLRWRSPMPMSMPKKISIGADRELHPSTPTKAQASAGSSTPRTAFDSLCLRSPLPKVLLQKLQGSAQKTDATKSPFASSVKTPPTQKKIKLVFKPASAMKMTPSEAKPVAHASPIVDPTYETPRKAMRPPVQTPVETKTRVKDSTPLGLSDQLALLQRQKLQKSGTPSTTKPVAVASMASTTIEFFDTPQKVKTRDATPSPAQAAASHAVAEAMAAVPMTPVTMTPTKLDEGPTHSFMAPPTALFQTPVTTRKRTQRSPSPSDVAPRSAKRTLLVSPAKNTEARTLPPPLTLRALTPVKHKTPATKAKTPMTKPPRTPAKPKTPKPKTPKLKAPKLKTLLPKMVTQTLGPLALVRAPPTTSFLVVQEPTLLLPRPKTPKQATISSATTQPPSTATPTNRSATIAPSPLGPSRNPTPVKATTKAPSPRPTSSVVEREHMSVERDDEEASFEYGGGSAASSEAEVLPTPPKKPASIKVATPKTLPKPSVAKSTPTSTRKRLKLPDAPAVVAAAEASDDDDDLPMLVTSSPERGVQEVESTEEVAEPFPIVDRRVDPLAKHFTFQSASSSDDASGGDDDNDDDQDDDEDDGTSRRISDEFAKEMRGLNESDLVVDEKTVELHKWSVVWPPRMKSATNIILTVRGCNGSKDGPVTSVVYKSYQSPRHFLSAAGEEVHLVGTMATKSVPIPSVRAFFKAGIPRMWRAKVPSLLVVSDKDEGKVKNRVISSLGAFLDAPPERDSSSEDEEGSSNQDDDDEKSDLDEDKDQASSASLDSESESAESSSPQRRRAARVSAVREQPAIVPKKRGRPRKDATATAPVAPRAKAKRPLPKAKPAAAPKVKVEKPAKRRETDSGDAWTPVQIAQLKQAIQMLPASTPEYWTKVARAVKGKTGDECQRKQFEALGSAKKPKAPAATGRLQEKLSRAGTIKRKIQVRQFVHDLEQKTADDVYTPRKHVPATDLDALASPQSNKKLKRTYASSSNDGSSSDDEDTLFSPITFGKRNEVDSYINQLHKQSRKQPPTRTVPQKRPIDDGRSSMAMETKVGAHSLVGTMTPNGTTRLRLSRDSDFSDSVDISYDLDNADDSSDDEDDVEASDFADDN